MRKHGSTPSLRDKYVTLAAISTPGVARGRFVGGHQSGLAGCESPSLFKRRASSCSSQRQRQREPWGASPRPSAPTYLPTCAYADGIPFAPYVSGRARVNMFSRLHLVVIVFLFLFRIVRRGAARNILVFGGRWCCGCLFVFWLFGFGCVVFSFGCVWLPGCVLRFILSSFPFLPLHTMLLFRSDDGLVVLVVTGIPFVPYVCSVRGWAWSLGYTPWCSLSARLPSCFSWRRGVALHGI